MTDSLPADFDQRRALSYTIADFRKYLIDKLDRSERTATSYADMVRLFSKWFETTNGQILTGTANGAATTNLTQTDVREYRSYLQRQGRAPATINAHLAALKAFGAWCGVTIEAKGIDQQPLAPRWLDRRQESALLREAERSINAQAGPALKAIAERNYQAIVLLLNTGLRVSEVTQIKHSDVTLTARAGKLIVRAEIAKGGKQREVALNRDARSMLSKITLPLGVKSRQVQKAIREISRRANLTGVTPHVLRHTFCHNLASANVAQDRIATLAGHANLNTTRRYTQPGEQDLQNAVEALE
jgi:site-specific recombinase XerD